MKDRVLVVIVTYNSEKHIQWCIDGLNKTSSNITIRIVDSGSKETNYLNTVESTNEITIIKKDNIGFVAGNNTALYDLDFFDWVLFLNPDACIDSESFDSLISYAAREENNKVGAFTVPLIRYDIEKKCSLNLFDSVGINCSYLGRWHDIYANNEVCNIEESFTEVDAICGAFMLVRREALKSSADSTGGLGFERKYFMYKEDIELSQRIIKSGWKIGVYNLVTAFHCRGWSDSRKVVPYWARWHSAKNDVDVAFKYKWRALPFALIKLIWVRFLENK
ncbi:glycosyltransferase [Gibbsiella dentisursi]|uniref:Glycosyltransferase n=1 Tax=Gibbsiella dentisursi TaxID=796890 RepID=A0ABP7KQ09_9GAMM